MKFLTDCELYNYHSHTQWCDGRAPAAEIAEAACKAGFRYWGITPHSPLCQPSPCNMSAHDVPEYIAEVDRLKELYDGTMRVFTGMEVDFMSRDFGPHIDYFQNLPLEYRIGSVHFVPNQEGKLIDCDGSAARFATNLVDFYHNDLQYVVEKFFEQELTMIELGGFELLGHFDKIIGNAITIDPALDSRHWYRSLVLDVIEAAKSTGLTVEINTKAIVDRQRFYPDPQWWPMLIEAGIPLVINSDTHYPEKVNIGRSEAAILLKAL